MTNYHLLLVLIIVYLAECFIFHDQEAVIITKNLLNKWKCKLPEINFSKTRTPFTLNNIFFPFLPVYVIHPFPIIYSPTGILVLYKNKKEYYQFSQINEISCSSNKIIINNKKTIKLFSSKQAKIHYNHILNLKITEQNKRQQKIMELIEKTVHLKNIKSKLKLFKKNTLLLKIISTITYLILFFILPIYYYFHALNITFIKMLFSLLAFHFLTVLFFYINHKKFYPDLKEERFLFLLALLFSPPAAVKAIQYLSKNLIIEYDPLAITNTLNNKKIQLSVCDYLLRKTTYKKIDDTNSVNQDIYNFFNKNYLKVLQKFIKNQKIKIEQLDKSPDPETDEMERYCPLCLTQFKKQREYCSECKIKLLKLQKNKYEN